MKYLFKTILLLVSALLIFSPTVRSQTAGDAFFADNQIHEIRFNFSQPGFLDSLKTNYTLDQYMRCDLEVDGVAYPSCGVKYKGNSSYNNQGKKKPFRIDFEEYVDSQEVDGLEKLVLNNAFKDPTLLREKLMLDFLNDHGIAAPRASFARLYLNGYYWGLYSVVEDVNKTFLKDRFENKGGNLFKGDPHGTLTWKGADPSLYMADYELKTNETENDWSDLVQLLNALNNTPSAQLADSLDQHLNLDSWFSYWAAHNLFVNLDSYIGSGHNYFLYHNKDTDKFEWTTWDVNEAFGNFNMGLSLANLKTLAIGYIPNPANQRPMMNRLWQDPSLQKRLADRLCALLDDFDNAHLDARIDALANLIRPAVQADTLKFYSNTLFEQNLSQDVNIGGGPGGGNIAGLKAFVTARHNSLEQQLAGFGCSLSGVSNAFDGTQIKLSPNPFGENLSLSYSSEKEETLLLTWANLSGQTVLTETLQVQKGMNEWQPALPIMTGMYFLTIAGETGKWTQKVVRTGF
ncbi:MAG: CotH kinase family protein [Phycisphaerae bacterium]|nr:CotH kinase family protein [Saprospiraceae bacterium]